MWNIFKNEWLFYSRTPWLLGTSVGFVLVLILSIALGNYQTQKK